MPRLSVILPVRNSGRTLVEALDSLRRQTFTDFDVHLYDDGSSDNTPDIIERFAARDRRFRPAGRGHLGIIGALNRCAAASDAPLLARMDGDDISHPERFSDTLALFESAPDLAVASVLVEGFPSGALGPGMDRYIAWLNSRVTPREIALDMFVESPLCHPAVVMRRSAFEAAGGYLDDGGPEDYGLWLRLHLLGQRMAKVPRKRFFWRDGPTRLSRTDARYHRDRFLASKINALEPLHLFAGRAVVIWGAGKIGRSWSRALEAIEHAPVAFIDVDSKKIGRTVHGVPVFGVPEHRRDIPSGLVLVAVGSADARARIRHHLAGLGLEDGRHFVCVA